MRYSKIQYVCWLFSGAEISLLKECPTDFNRQASIGFTILMTCLFAGLAGGFAAWRFSEGSGIAAILFGFVWAMLIFSIDRSMVVTLKKDPTKESSWLGIGSAFLARMTLAGLLAFLISIPLETFIFKIQIANQIDRQNGQTSDSTKVEKERFYGLPGLKADKAKLEAQLANARDNANLAEPPTGQYKAAAQQTALAAGALNSLEGDIRYSENAAANALQQVPRILRDTEREWLGTRPNTNSGAWARYVPLRNKSASLRRQRQTMVNALAQARSEQSSIKTAYYAANANLVTELENSTRTKLTQVDAAIVKANADVAAALVNRNAGGFMREFTALEDAAAKDGGLLGMLWLIRAMFFIIELLPTIVKLVTPLGEYDRQLHAHERMFALALDTNYHILEQREQLRQQTELKIAEQLEQIRSDREIELGKNVLEQTATIQNALAKQMLNDWHKKERDVQKAASMPKTSGVPASQVPLANNAHTPTAVPAVQVPLPVPNAAAIASAPSLNSVPSVGSQPDPTTATVGSQPDPTIAAAVQSATSVSSSTVPDTTAQAQPIKRSVTLAALTTVYQWKPTTDALRTWYRFENGATNNRVRRYLGSITETGSWEHPEGDTDRLRLTFNQDVQDFHIQRLTNQEMTLQNVATNDVLNFTT